MLWPYSSGSITWPITMSLPMNTSSTSSARDQPGATASPSSSGGTTAMKLPMKGTKRIRPARMPHSTGFGRPTHHSAVAMKVPKPVFSANWIRK